jgi:MFS family permease
MGALKSGWLTAFSIAGIGALMGGLFYGLHIFPNSFLPTHFPSISHAQALKYTSIGIGIYMFFLPLMGWVADRISHTKCMQLFAFLTILLSYPIIYFLMSGKVFYIILSEALASILLAGFMAPATFVMAQSFLPSFRHRLVSFSYNLGASLIGGLTPIVFLFLTETLNLLYGPGIFIALCGVIGLFSSYCLGRKTDLRIFSSRTESVFASSIP